MFTNKLEETTSLQGVEPATYGVRLLRVIRSRRFGSLSMSSIRCAKTIEIGAWAVWGVGRLGRGLFGGIGCLGCSAFAKLSNWGVIQSRCSNLTLTLASCLKVGLA